jgi:hypothetical protein
MGHVGIDLRKRVSRIGVLIHVPLPRAAARSAVPSTGGCRRASEERCLITCYESSGADAPLTIA